jgi:hypothetical protein
MVEYMLLTAVVVIGAVLVFSLLQERDYFFTRITKPMVGYLKYNYKYGDKDSQGWDEGGSPRQHIQISKPNDGQNFKLFLPRDP